MRTRKNKMKIKMQLIIGAVLVSAAIIITGCANETVTPATATSPAVTNYTANTAATAVANGAELAAPLVPQPYGAAVGAVGLLIAGIAGGIATYKNSQANLHLSTLQSVVSAIESSLPGVSEAITATLPAASGNVTATQALTTATAALGAVKAAISSATTASGTANNLDEVAASVGAGPSAA